MSAPADHPTWTLEELLEVPVATAAPCEACGGTGRRPPVVVVPQAQVQAPTPEPASAPSSPPTVATPRPSRVPHGALAVCLGLGVMTIGGIGIYVSRDAAPRSLVASAGGGS